MAHFIYVIGDNICLIAPFFARGRLKVRSPHKRSPVSGQLIRKCALRWSAGIDDTIREVQAIGGNCTGYIVDISKKADVYAAADTIRRDVGDVSIRICVRAHVRAETPQNCGVLSFTKPLVCHIEIMACNKCFAKTSFTIYMLNIRHRLYNAIMRCPCVTTTISLAGRVRLQKRPNITVGLSNRDRPVFKRISRSNRRDRNARWSAIKRD